MRFITVCVLVLSLHGARSCEITRDPRDVIADIGESVTFTCITPARCKDNGCIVHWQQRNITGEYVTFSTCSGIYKTYRTDRHSVSLHPTEDKWSLNIARIQSSDARQYRCSVYSHPRESRTTSSPAHLILQDDISAVVQPPSYPLMQNDEATFSCKVYPENNARLNYRWFLNSMVVVRKPGSLVWGKQRQRLTISRVDTTLNNTNVSCVVYRGDKLIKSSEDYVLLVFPESEPTTSKVEAVVTQETIISKPEIVTAIDANKISTPNLRQQPTSLSLQPTLGKEEPNADENVPPASESGNSSMPLIVGGAVAVFFLILVISILLYFLLFKDRSKTNAKPKAYESHSAGDDETGIDANGMAETEMSPRQLQSALVSDHATESAHQGSERSAVLPNTDVEVTVLSNQYPGTKRDRSDVDTTLSTKGAKMCKGMKSIDMTRCTIGGKDSEVIYTLPDKWPAKGKALGTDHARNTAPKVNEDAAKKPGEPKRATGDESAQKRTDDFRNELELKKEKPTASVKPRLDQGCALNRPSSSGVKPPSVTPYHLSKRRTCTTSHNSPEATRAREENGKAKVDPRQKNIEGLIYADLDLSQGQGGGGATIIQQEEETVYAAVVNQKTVGKLREGSEGHASSGMETRD